MDENIQLAITFLLEYTHRDGQTGEFYFESEVLGVLHELVREAQAEALEPLMRVIVKHGEVMLGINSVFCGDDHQSQLEQSWGCAAPDGGRMEELLPAKATFKELMGGIRTLATTPTPPSAAPAARRVMHRQSGTFKRLANEPPDEK